MSSLALTDENKIVLAKIESLTKVLSTKIGGFEIKDSTDTIEAKVLKDEATQLEKMVEEMRTKTVAPYNDFVSQVNAKAKEYSNPIKELKEAIVNKIKDYQLAVQKEEERKGRVITDTIQRLTKATSIEDLDAIFNSKEFPDGAIEIVYSRKKVEIAEDIRLAEVKKQQDAENARLAELQKSNDAEAIRIQKESMELAEKQRKIDLENQQIEAQKIDEVAIAKLSNEIVQPVARVKGTRTVWKMAIENPDLIPRELMIPDEKKINELVKTGTRSIAGVRIYEDIIVG